MLNDHDPDGVDGFVAVYYIDPDHFVAEGPEFNRPLWSSFFTASSDTGRLTADIVRDAELNIYPGTHGLPATFTGTYDDDDLLAVARR